jgi:hypothetical protein
MAWYLLYVFRVLCQMISVLFFDDNIESKP